MMREYDKELIKRLFLGYLNINRNLFEFYYTFVLYSSSLFCLIFFPFLIIFGPNYIGFSLLLTFLLIISLLIPIIIFLIVILGIIYGDKFKNTRFFSLVSSLVPYILITGSVFFLSTMIYLFIISDGVQIFLDNFSAFNEEFFKEILIIILLWVFYAFTFGIIGLYMIAQTEVYLLNLLREKLGLKKKYFYIPIFILFNAPLMFAFAAYYLFTIDLFFSFNYDFLVKPLVWIFGVSIILIHMLFLGSKAYGRFFKKKPIIH